MGRFFDFAVSYDPDKDSDYDLFKRIIYVLFVKRLRGKKPVVIFIGGDSGEGKSWGALRLQEIILELQGLNAINYISNMNVYTPLEYPKKIDDLIFNKELKKVNVITIHEARHLVRAKLWYSFLNQAVADVNATSRSLKRLCFIVISQFIRDIAPDIRYTLNYYITAYRPIGRRTQLSISVLWKDDSDLEKPRLRKRRVRGYLVYPNGKRKLYCPEYFEIEKPDKEITTIFEKAEFDAKSSIIKSKINKLIKEMSCDIDDNNNKIDTMARWYVENPESLNLIGKRNKRGKWKIKKEVITMHELTELEKKQFEKKLNEQLQTVGMIEE